MWQEILAFVSRVTAPLAKVTSGTDNGKGEIKLATSGTAVRVQVPTWLAGKYAEFTAQDAACDVLFGDSTVDVVYNQVTTVASEVMTVHASTGRHIPAGQTVSWVVPLSTTHAYMSVEAAGSGYLSIGVSSGKIIK